MNTIILDKPLTYAEIALIAKGECRLALSDRARTRIDAANRIVRTIVHRNIRAYGINTGVGALMETLIPEDQQSALSHNILMSHAVGVGEPLTLNETRAIMAAAVNNFAHGYSGLRAIVVDRLIEMINNDCIPVVPRLGSVGYLSHMAHIALAVIGAGTVNLKGETLPSRDAPGFTPLTLEAKEGLSLVNGTPCTTGLACLVLDRSKILLDWADAIAAMSCESLACQTDAFQSPAITLRQSSGLSTVCANLSKILEGSGILTKARGRQTQDALSLRSIPQIHGAVRDVIDDVEKTITRELQSVTDNPVVMGSIEEPEVYSQAHAVGAALGLALDSLAVALSQLGMISERRLDRLTNPLVSGLPAFLTSTGGVTSGLMIAQYTAVSLVSDNRRLSAPASLDGGITSALQEDILCHATPAALKALTVLDNSRNILAIELMAACQAYDFIDLDALAPGTKALYRQIRHQLRPFEDDSPLSDSIAFLNNLLRSDAVNPLTPDQEQENRSRRR